MSLFDARINSHPDQIDAYDTAKPANGAAAKPGEVMEWNHPTYGIQRYRYVRNATGSTLAQGSLLSWNDLTAGQELVKLAPVATPRWMCPGAVQRSGGLPTGYWGWVLCEGDGLYLGAATVDAGDYLVCVTTAGRLDTVAAGAATPPGTVADSQACVGFSITATTVGATGTAKFFPLGSF